ncbi:MAG: peptide chain release factor 1 [Nitrospirae bacterium]|nr:peptide chain release factor 1 [Nitrospirota bacterium]
MIEESLFQKLEELHDKYLELGHLLSDPKVIANRSEFQRLAKEQSELALIAEEYNSYKEILRKLREAEEIGQDPTSDPELKEMAILEKKDLEQGIIDLERRIKKLLLPKDTRDAKNVFLEIRAGAGGNEAGLFVADLFRMYSRYAEKKGWKVDIINSNETGIGGYKEIILYISGRGIFSRMRFESGVHRVQRIPVTEASGRIHTSTVTVAVLPEAEEVEIHVDPKDLRVDTFCASGPGGQGVNTTYSAVRITHLPTGMAVSCQDERSQIKNKEKAMRVLRSRLLEIKEEEERSKREQDRREQVGTGDRSERIRTYNFPQNRVTDHRIGLTLHRLEAVLEGDLDEMFDALSTTHETERLKSL